MSPLEVFWVLQPSNIWWVSIHYLLFYNVGLVFYITEWVFGIFGMFKCTLTLTSILGHTLWNSKWCKLRLYQLTLKCKIKEDSKKDKHNFCEPFPLRNPIKSIWTWIPYNSLTSGICISTCKLYHMILSLSGHHGVHFSRSSDRDRLCVVFWTTNEYPRKYRANACIRVNSVQLVRVCSIDF